MSLNLPLIAKDPSGRPQVLGIGRISTEHQPLSNIDASKAYVLNFLDRTDSGNYDMTFLGERASGMLVDRETITQAMELIESGKIDLVISEELSRIYRNPQFQFAFAHLCVDTDTRLICIGDNIDTRYCHFM